MNVAFRYFALELLTVLAVVFVVLFVIGLSGQITGYLEDAASGRISVEGLWVLIALRLPEYAQLIIPFSLFLAVLLTFGRLHAEQEYVIFVMGGSSPLQMAGWVVAIALPLAILVGSFSLYLTPWSKGLFYQLLIEEKVSSEFDAVVPGQFRKFGGGKRVTFVEDNAQEQGGLRGVFFYEDLGDSQSILWAEEGRVATESDSADRFLELNEGHIHVGNPGLPNYRLIEFDKVSVRLNLGLNPDIADEPSARNLAELNLATGEARGEYHWRFALPLLTLLGALCAFAIARTRPRSGRYGQIFPGLMIFLTYYVLLLVARKLVEEYEIQLLFGLWPVHMLAAVTFMYFCSRLSRPR